MAQEARGAIARGEDPCAAKSQRKAAAVAAVKALKAPARDSVEAVVVEFIERHAKAKTRDWRETERLLMKEVVGAWKGRRLSEIDRADVHRLLDAIVDRGAPVGANRVFAQLRKLCKWAVSRGIIARSPCDGVERPSAETARDRMLSDDELRLLWRGAEQVGWPFGDLTRLLILTGQRRSEVAGMTWDELDLTARTWTVPAARAKNGREHQVPLSAPVMTILETLPRVGSTYVFTTNGATSVSGFSRGKARLDAALKAANDGAAIEPWTLHDIRRSVASGLAGVGVNLPVIERLLNHVSGSFAGIVGVYQRHDFADATRDAMTRWGRHIEALAAGEAASNVVTLRTAKVE
jgi:integrase